jgi:hypothetical protein
MVLRVDPKHPNLDGHRFVHSMRDIIEFLPTDEIVECQTLDDYFLPQEGLINFMKIDVEGAELSLLQGAEKTLARSGNITVLLECTQNQEQVRDLLAQWGFQCFIWERTMKILKPVMYDKVIGGKNIILRRKLRMD